MHWIIITIFGDKQRVLTSWVHWIITPIFGDKQVDWLPPVLEELNQFLHLGEKKKTKLKYYRNFFVIVFSFSITDLILSILMIVAASCLIYGVQKKSLNFLLPALSVCPFDMFMRVIFVFIHSITLGFFHPISITRNIRLCCGIIFDTFLWFCIFSQMKMSKNQDSQQDLQMDNEIQTPPVPKY